MGWMLRGLKVGPQCEPIEFVLVYRGGHEEPDALETADKKAPARRPGLSDLAFARDRGSPAYSAAFQSSVSGWISSTLALQ
jgi:hypothetical protein